jgi:glycine N-methyltransferase
MDRKIVIFCIDSSFRNHQFRLSYYPHLLNGFKALLEKIFGEKMKHEIFGDFLPIGDIKHPAYYIHVVEKLK